MINQLVKAIKTILRWGYHYVQVWRLFHGFNSPSYARGEMRPKPKIDQLIDFMYLFFVLRVLPTNYHLFQFDVKPRVKFKEYMDEPSSPSLRHKLYEHLWNDAYSSLVNDKYIFHCVSQYHHLPVPRMYGVFRKGNFVAEDGERYTVQGGDDRQVVLKPIRGKQGKGIYFVTMHDVSSLSGGAYRNTLPESFMEESLVTDFVVQELIRQHPKLDEVNPYSLNTIRMITLLTRENEVIPLAAMLRTSSNESPIDNFSTGGIVVGINMETGNLSSTGFLKTPHGTTMTAHPVTGKRFSDVQIPYWEELKGMAVKAQRSFYQLKAIGWDFAVTTSGPVLIEGNLEWGTAGIQAATGGLLTKRNRELLARLGLQFNE